MADLEPMRQAARASDADRDRVLAVLAEATADGRIDMDEHAERMVVVLHARTLGELEAVTSDLGEPAESSGTVAVVDATARLLAVLGSKTRSGHWRVPTEFRVTAVVGSIELDFTDAVFDGHEALCLASSYLGAIEIIVPDWVQVVDDGSAFLGAREDAPSSQVAPRVTLRLRGVSVLGAVEIKRSAPRGPKGPSLEERSGG